MEEEIKAQKRDLNKRFVKQMTELQKNAIAAAGNKLQSDMDKEENLRARQELKNKLRMENLKNQYNGATTHIPEM